jgi:hypothetical protein
MPQRSLLVSSFFHGVSDELFSEYIDVNYVYSIKIYLYFTIVLSENQRFIRDHVKPEELMGL